MADSAEAIRAALTSVVGRVVAGVTTVVLLPVLPSVVSAVNSITSLGLTDGQVMEYAKAAAVGGALVVSTWLFNRGRFEATALKVKDAYDAGAVNVAGQGVQRAGPVE
jgi:uncharacterized membrane protein